MDETQPLLPAEAARAPGLERDQPVDKNLVTFDPEGDAENPLDWPSTYKWSIVGLLAFMAFTVTFTCISVVPVANRIVADLDDGRASKSASVLLVTIWELGEAAGPLLIAPLSEMYGRYPVMNVCNVGFILTTLLAVLSENSTMFIAARALTGVVVATNVLNPAIVGDLFVSERRGSAMSLISLAPLTGGAVGPLISVAVSENLGWRAVCWMSIILAGIAEIGFLTCFRETYRVPILNKKAARLRQETGNVELKSPYDESAHSVAKLRDAMMRPLIVLSHLDKVFVRLRDKNGGIERPEYRLPFVILGSFLLPLAIAFYGWVPQLHLSVPFLYLAITLFGATLTFCFMPTLTYVVDAFGLYSASALTAMIVTRCLMSTFLPLLATPLVDSFGYGWGFTILAAMMLSMAPVPICLFRYGHRWRQWAKYTKDE
ncbi:hypothetical protein LQW54_005155 [Pestalotiopsis sp. IQ-011]